MGSLTHIYNRDALGPGMSDAYHFATPQVYGEEGRLQNEAVFYMFGRKEAFNGGYTIAAGLEDIMDIVDVWKEDGFTRDTVALLRNKRTTSGIKKYSDAFLDLLSEEITTDKYPEKIDFTLQIDAVPEGTAVMPHEPLLRVRGPMMQCKLLESIALGIMNGQSAFATRAARIVDAVTQDVGNGAPTHCKVSVQGLRRGPGVGAAIESTGALLKGGFHSTSTGAGAMEYGAAFVGTMDHQFVMQHENEIGAHSLNELFALQRKTDADSAALLREYRAQDAFRSFAMQYPESGIFLVDTYDPEQGLENAITVIRELREIGKSTGTNVGKSYGVRFDSGDITALSQKALRRFAEEGWVSSVDPATVATLTDAELLHHSNNCNVIVAASDGIDEYSALEMRSNGAYITSWGIGTAGSHPDPLGLVYKMSLKDTQDRGNRPSPRDVTLTPAMKVASNAPVKSSNPGLINSHRYYDDNGTLACVVIFDELQGRDPAGEMINLRNYSDRTQAGTQSATSVLVPVYDRDGSKVYDPEAVYLTESERTSPVQSERRSMKIKNGYGKPVTDVTLIARHVKQELDRLPEAARRIVRPLDELMGHALMHARAEALAAGKDGIEGLAAIEANVRRDYPQVEHVPVYLDANLFRMRQAIEAQHTHKTNTSGMGGYHERFEGGNDDVPSPDISGDLKATGSRKEIQL